MSVALVIALAVMEGMGWKERGGEEREGQEREGGRKGRDRIDMWNRRSSLAVQLGI